MLSNKFSTLAIDDDMISSSTSINKKHDSFATIRKYYNDHVADRMKVFDEYPYLYDDISCLEFSAYANSGYIKEVILPFIDALRDFESLNDRQITFYFGNTLDMFKVCVDDVFSEVDYVLNRHHKYYKGLLY